MDVQLEKKSTLQIINTGHRTLDTGHRTLDTGHWTQDTGHWTQDTGGIHLTRLIAVWESDG